MTSFSCVLFGGDTLLLECAQVLIEAGHDIKGVVTETSRVRDFCEDRDIPVFDARTDYEAALRERSFEHLFAITHLAIIPDSVLGLPTGMSINFHDGPLPRYAGLNAPVWALIQREREYGITWHLMSAGVDEGDILLQRTFEIAPDETALSLNTRCMAAALASFPELISSISSGSVRREPQDLAQRTYYGRSARPARGGLIDWRSPTAEIDALVRGLAFGPYPNPVGVPKTVIDADTAVPFTVTALALGSMKRPEGVEPGRVLAVDDVGVHVATGDGVVAITDARTLVGEAASPEQLKLRPGQLFATGGDPWFGLLEDTDATRSRHERFWVNRLATSLERVPAMPFVGPARGAPSWRTIESSLPSDLDERADEDLEADVLTALVIYLARVGGVDSFHVALLDPAMRTGIAEVDRFYVGRVPLEVDLDPTWSVRQVITSVREELKGLRRRGPFLHDLVQRQRLLPSPGAVAAQASQPVAVSLCGDDADPVPGEVLALRVARGGRAVRLVFDANRVSEGIAEGLLESLSVCVAGVRSGGDRSWTELTLISDSELRRQIEDWNATGVEYDRATCIHKEFERQVDRTPEARAVVFRDESLSYRELDERANQLARHLRGTGMSPGSIVGVHVARSLDLSVATLGVLKAGGAYLPLDPEFPAERLALMLEDSGVERVITQGALAASLPPLPGGVVRIDDDWPSVSAQSASRPAFEVDSSDLAYVIYTSGSTGRPKGVLIQHRNVVNFFAAMDAVIDHDPAGVWLAVTSLSFDISVLELFWTLARGFTVVLYSDPVRLPAEGPRYAHRPMDFGLFMWGNDDGPGPDKYRLMLEGARFFDRNGFDSVWTPERHFHAFGGPFPNPSVTGAAIAAVTERIGIRSGSCVSPLHHPIRIAEEWAVVDNLSGGRVGLSFAAGWQPNDFVLRPESFPDQKRIMLEQIDVVRRLWRGEAVEFPNPMGKMVPVTTLPRPVQEELPYWITTAGNPESYEAAGELGANVLTHLLGQTLDEVAAKIERYRTARERAGYDPSTGVVTLMLHTFVGDDDATVREVVRAPMKRYLAASMKLVLGFAWSFPAFKRPGGRDSTPDDLDLSTLSDEDTESILDFAFERYFETSGLFGTVETCGAMVDRCKAAGVDEIACLLDFGVDTDLVMSSLPALKSVRDEANRGPAARSNGNRDEPDYSFAAQVRAHEVTHLQCTPSLARLILGDAESQAALAGLRHLMVGGEALTLSTAKELAAATTASITNMYGPTETTIWSATHGVDASAETIPIGRAVANTAVYVLDRFRQPLPVGMPGELYIGGDGVARGYHDRPELTAERFVPDPFRGGGSRVYRTGDRVRYRPDGTLEFLGRVDNQVKIRGYRVEPGEIEAVLDRHPDVRTSAVLLREEHEGDQRLVAYVVPSGSGVDPDTLRSFVREALPEYMTPGHVLVIAEMPLTPNGKVNRLALAELPIGTDPVAHGVPDEPPEGALEAAIAEAWRDVLKVERIGVEQNFFDAGGHSLLVVQLHRRLGGSIEHAVSLVDLYRFPTIRSLAGHLEQGGKSSVVAQSEDRADRRRQAMQRRNRSGRK